MTIYSVNQENKTYIVEISDIGFSSVSEYNNLKHGIFYINVIDMSNNKTYKCVMNGEYMGGIVCDIGSFKNEVNSNFCCEDFDTVECRKSIVYSIEMSLFEIKHNEICDFLILKTGMKIVGDVYCANIQTYDKTVSFYKQMFDILLPFVDAIKIRSENSIAQTES